MAVGFFDFYYKKVVQTITLVCTTNVSVLWLIINLIIVIRLVAVG